MSRTQSIALAAVIAIVAVASGILSARWLLQQKAGAQSALTTATLLSPPRPLPPLEFVDQDNRPFGTDRLRGGWTFLFFGFTHCPDVCPATLSALAQTNKLLADLPGALRPQVVMISVDPERDTPEQPGCLCQGVRSDVHRPDRQRNPRSTSSRSASACSSPPGRSTATITPWITRPRYSSSIPTARCARCSRRRTRRS